MPLSFYCEAEIALEGILLFRNKNFWLLFLLILIIS